MVTIRDRLKVFVKNKLLAYILLFISKLLSVLISIVMLQLTLSLIGYDFTLKTFFGCVGLYFVFEELYSRFDNKKRILRGNKK